MKKALSNFVAEESGQGLVEYGLIIALVSIALIGVLGTLNGGLQAIFTEVSTTLTTALPGPTGP